MLGFDKHFAIEYLCKLQYKMGGSKLVYQVRHYRGPKSIPIYHEDNFDIFLIKVSFRK